MAVVHDLFHDSVLDLAWSQIKDQTVLLACSTDGSIAALVLSEDEIGISLSPEDKVNNISFKIKDNFILRDCKNIYTKINLQNSIFQREYGKIIDLNMSESSMDKGIVPEYSELLYIDENKSTDTSILNNNNATNNNIVVNNNKNPPQFGDVEMSTVPISTKSTVIQQNPIAAKAIDKQIETRRADGKRRITAMFIPLNSVAQDRYVECHLKKLTVFNL